MLWETAYTQNGLPWPQTANSNIRYDALKAIAMWNLIGIDANRQEQLYRLTGNDESNIQMHINTQPHRGEDTLIAEVHV